MLLLNILLDLLMIKHNFFLKINTLHVCELGERERKQKMLIQELAGNAITSTVDDEGKKQNNDGKNSHELHVFSFESIYVATSNFSTENKLGEGGFGLVYKVSS